MISFLPWTNNMTYMLVLVVNVLFKVGRKWLKKNYTLSFNRCVSSTAEKNATFIVMLSKYFAQWTLKTHTNQSLPTHTATEIIILKHKHTDAAAATFSFLDSLFFKTYRVFKVGLSPQRRTFLICYRQIKFKKSIQMYESHQ